MPIVVLNTFKSFQIMGYRAILLVVLCCRGRSRMSAPYGNLTSSQTTRFLNVKRARSSSIFLCVIVDISPNALHVIV